MLHRFFATMRALTPVRRFTRTRPCTAFSVPLWWRHASRARNIGQRSSLHT